MPYHEPDAIWEVFDLPDFGAYVEKFVVRGRFHSGVPEDVVKGYTVAEHIMALAYYYYPMYEEALVKLLRTLELGVRLRCAQLGIATTFTDNKGKKQGKNLGALIDQLAAKEPSKSIKETLDGLRELRNIFMHPTENMLLGSTAIHAIRQTLVQLNALFLPEQFFSDAKKELDGMQSAWRPFERGLFILDQGGYQVVINESQVVEAYRDGSAWVYLVCFKPIFKEIKKCLEQGYQAHPVLLVLREVTVEPGMMRGTNISDGMPVMFFETDRPDIQALSEQFQAEMALVEESVLWAYQTSLTMEIKLAKMRYRYKYWGGND